MAKKNQKPVTALKRTILEFVDKLRDNENELQEIKDRRKDLIEEYKEQLDVKAIKAALQIVKIRNNVTDQAALDNILATIDATMGGYLEPEDDEPAEE